jgi:hypothetical protein
MLGLNKGFGQVLIDDRDSPRVFISYSHDSDAHLRRVRELSDRLRSEGIDSRMDQYIESPPEGWPQWMDRQIARADYVLVVCTRNYAARLRGEQQGRGHGVKWEGALITQAIHDAETRNTKFIPIIFVDDTSAIPLFLRGATHYLVSTGEGYDALYRRLTGQPRVVPAPLGPLRLLPPVAPHALPDALRRGGAVLSHVDQRHAPDPVTFDAFLEYVAAFVAADQIAESGGWARSQNRVFEYTIGQPPSTIDRREGGIMSTYIALRALAATGVDLAPHVEPGRSATKYLLKRQTKSGMFGRFSVSRSGEEIKPSLRHTALACLALMIIDGPPEPIARGLDCLTRVKRAEVADDAAPSIAMSAALVALDTAANGEWGDLHLSSDHRKAISHATTDLEHEFLESIESESKDPSASYAPLWEPYGRSARMLYDSALTTIDFLTLYPRSPWSSVCTVLQYLADNRIHGALPYDSSAPGPDVGISSYFAAICYRPSVMRQLMVCGATGVLDAASDCLAFSLANWETPDAMLRTYCDTLANALLLRQNEA